MPDATLAVAARTKPAALKDHDLAPFSVAGLKFEKRPARTPQGAVVPDLYNAWIILDNPTQFNSYTTEMVKAAVLAFRAASAARDVVAVVFTGTGDKAFCTGGNTKEYAEYYAGNPQEYRQYMRLFNDMVSAILGCDKPVICRVNGMRIGGGQEIGMACDFSIAQDLARFGQAGPKHGSAAIGGATDFLPLMMGMERAIESGTLCEHWSAHKAYRMGLLYDIVPALKLDGKFLPNPLVVTDRYLDEYGRIVHGEPKTGEALAEGKRLLARGTVDLSRLDEKVEQLSYQAHAHLPGVPDEELRGAAQAQARGLEPQQGGRPRLARPQHARGGAHGVPRLQRGAQGKARNRLRGAASVARQGNALVRGADGEPDP